VTSPTRTRGTTAADLAPAKRRAFLVFTLVFPFLFFALAETMLRTTGYGPDLSLFTTETIGGKTWHVMNPSVKSRYFANVAFSPNTSSDYFQSPKNPGVYRIFCLGGSTTVGFPYGFTGSFSSHLRNRLAALFPDRPVEVINLGMTATNSHTVLDIARDLPPYEPDLLIVYDGHNEFYGALGVASHERTGGSLFMTRLALRMVHWKTFMLARDAWVALRETLSGIRAMDQKGTMMERLARGQEIPYGSDTYREGLEVFTDNLGDLSEFCSERGIPLILATQVSNLRGQPPFISGWTVGGHDAEYEAAHGLLERGNVPEALEQARRATTGDSLHAASWYLAARALDTLGRIGEARGAYVRARDYDRLRFRTSTDFNEAIRSAARGAGTMLADVEALFAALSPDSITGNDLILEHLHPNARGYFLIAREFAAAMRRGGLLASPADWAARDTLSDERLWELRHLTSLDEALAARRVQMLTSEWPFVPQTVPLAPVPPNDRLATIVERMAAGELTWEEGHVAAAELYSEDGDLENAEREARALVNQLPVNVSASLLLGQILLRRGDLGEAHGVFTRSLEIEETAFGRRALGSILLDAGKTAEAVPFLERAWAIAGTRDERCENGTVLALAYSRLGEKQRAIAQLQTVLSANPDYAPARGLLRKLQQ
jgi:tetratricopeptide (TPR) repeat protein